MDDCTLWEINDIIENLPYLDRNMWEIGRMLTFTTAQCNSTKKLNIQDFGKFKWDDPLPMKRDISNKDIERLRQKAKQWEN